MKYSLARRVGCTVQKVIVGVDVRVQFMALDLNVLEKVSNISEKITDKT